MALSLQTSALYGGLMGDPELAACLDDRAEIEAMIRVEAALARAEAAAGVIPRDKGQRLAEALSAVRIEPLAIADATARAGVPVPGLVAALRRRLDRDLAHWLHWGATSQDIADTALALRLRDALALIGGRLGALLDALAEKSAAHADLVMAGRTRTQIATPITFGLKIATWAAPLIEAEAGLPALRRRLLRVQLGGASGANTAIGEQAAEVIAALARELDLAAAPPWHTARGGLVALAGWLSELAAGLARLAGDLMILGRSEIGEVRAGTGGGSSTMPQKSNPIGAECVAALAEMARHAASGLTAAGAHGEERDGVRWMLEWEHLPRTLMATGAALRHAITLAETLEPDPDRMAANLVASPGVMAEAASFALARHMPREKAQAAVKAALEGPDPLGKALARACPDEDWDRILDPASAAEGARRTAEAIWAGRERRKAE